MTGRMYTLDGKLLCGSPEIRIGGKVYPVDDRKSNVQRIMKLFEEKSGGDDFARSDEALRLAFGKNYKEIEKLDMPFAAHQALIELVIKAITGEDPDSEPNESSFRDSDVV